ncbi:MAG: hypothetical protein R3C59_09100 [Planctomycetaceae bacterium]
MPRVIQTIGLYWRPDQIFWGAGSQAGKLLGVPASSTTSNPIDFREQSGIYVLYSEFHAIYVGQAGSGNQKLFARLKQHRTDDLAERWDRFTWFGLRRVLGNGDLSRENQAAHPDIATVLNHIEAILIHAMEPALNRQGGRFGNQVERYLQIRDDRLGPTPEEMIRDLWNACPD